MNASGARLITRSYAYCMSMGVPRNADEMYRYCMVGIYREASMGFTNLIVRFGQQWYEEIATKLRQEGYKVSFFEGSSDKEDGFLIIDWGT